MAWKCANIFLWRDHLVLSTFVQKYFFCIVSPQDAALLVHFSSKSKTMLACDTLNTSATCIGLPYDIPHTDYWRPLSTKLQYLQLCFCDFKLICNKENEKLKVKLRCVFTIPINKTCDVHSVFWSLNIDCVKHFQGSFIQNVIQSTEVSFLRILGTSNLHWHDAFKHMFAHMQTPATFPLLTSHTDSSDDATTLLTSDTATYQRLPYSLTQMTSPYLLTMPQANDYCIFISLHTSDCHAWIANAFNNVSNWQCYDTTTFTTLFSHSCHNST